MSWFTSSPARRNEDDNTASATASRWRICRMRHHERGFAFAIDQSDRELALMGLLRETIPKLAPWERVTFTHVAREEDANNLSLTVKALGRFEDLQSVQDFRVRVRIKPSLCDSCQKQRGRYFECT